MLRTLLSRTLEIRVALLARGAFAFTAVRDDCRVLELPLEEDAVVRPAFETPFDLEPFPLLPPREVRTATDLLLETDPFEDRVRDACCAVVPLEEERLVVERCANTELAPRMIKMITTAKKRLSRSVAVNDFMTDLRAIPVHVVFRTLTCIPDKGVPECKSPNPASATGY